MILDSLRYAVVGGGHGGQAIAAYLALQGVRVRLFNKTIDRIREVIRRGGIRLSGVFEGFGRLELATDHIGKAIYSAQIIMVAVPASAHRSIARLMAPFLNDGQMIILNPGRTGGAFEFRRELLLSGVEAAVTIVEAQTFPFASRITGPAEVTIYGAKRRVPAAALPASKTGWVLKAIRRVLPQYVPARSVLETSFDNIGAIFHPAPTLLNAERIITTGGDFEYYLEGITPEVAAVLEELDRERVRIARAYHVRATTAKDWVKMAYGSEGDTLYEVIQNNPGYRGIKAPSGLDHRYLFEDVPASLVPLAAFGRLAGVRTPTIDAIVDLAESLTGIDYRTNGRTLERMGFRGMGVSDIIQSAWYDEAVSGMTG